MLSRILILIRSASWILFQVNPDPIGKWHQRKVWWQTWEEHCGAGRGWACPTQGSGKEFRKNNWGWTVIYSSSRTGCIICGARCKMKTQDPLFGSESVQDGDSRTWNQVWPLKAGGTCSAVQPMCSQSLPPGLLKVSFVEKKEGTFFFFKWNISHSAPFRELSEYKLNEKKRKKNAQH